MGKLDVEQFAVELGLPCELLLEQLRTAGCSHSTATDSITEKHKAQLLEHLRQSHCVSLSSLETSEVQGGNRTGRVRTIQVEVRKRRVEMPKSFQTVHTGNAELTNDVEKIKVQGSEEVNALKSVVRPISSEPVNQSCEIFVVDGANVCRWQRQNPSIQPLLTILIALLENGDDFYCVFDASITHICKADASNIEAWLNDYPSKFFRVTASTRADGAILHDADHNNRRVITNDLFQEYVHDYPWLSQRYTDRLVQGNLQPSGLMTIDKLKYGKLSLITNTETMLVHFRKLLADTNVQGVVESGCGLQ